MRFRLAPLVLVMIVTSIFLGLNLVKHSFKAQYLEKRFVPQGYSIGYPKTFLVHYDSEANGTTDDSIEFSLTLSAQTQIVSWSAATINLALCLAINGLILYLFRLRKPRQ